MKKSDIITAFLLFMLVTPCCYAQPDFSVFSDIMSAFSTVNSAYKPNVKVAEDKFRQININSSRDDFLKVIEDKNISELELLKLNEKMYELGFFSLSELSKNKINDANFDFYKNTVKNFYEPKYKLTNDEETYLAEIYANIFYNDRAVDATNELSENKELLKKSDYANYLMALGYYKTNNYKSGLKSINEALDINPRCQNYKFLKIKLLAETGKRGEALRLFNSYNNKKNLPYVYRKKCELLKQFILFKTEKKQWERNYSLGRYYYTEGDYQKALKSLQNATLTKNKKNLALVWAMLSRTYLKLDDSQKAKEFAQKACKTDAGNKDANVTLARLAYLEDNYKKAFEYFKKAVKDDKLDTSIIKVAQIYQLNGEDEKAKKIYKSLIKKGDDEWEAFYNLAMIDETNKEEYLLNAVASNPMYSDAWSELVNLKIKNDDFSTALKYLKNMYYIDENDFRYYYYQGIINKKNGDYVKAVKFFEKCVDLNSEFDEAQRELIELKEFI